MEAESAMSKKRRTILMYGMESKDVSTTASSRPLSFIVDDPWWTFLKFDSTLNVVFGISSGLIMHT